MDERGLLHKLGQVLVDTILVKEIIYGVLDSLLEGIYNWSKIVIT